MHKHAHTHTRTYTHTQTIQHNTGEAAYRVIDDTRYMLDNLKILHR